MTQKLAAGVLTLSIALSVLFHVVAGIRLLDPDLFEKHKTRYTDLAIVCRAGYLILYLMMFLQWIVLANFFVRKKYEKL